MGDAVKTLLPLIIFAGGMVALFALSWKNKAFVVAVTFVLTVLLFSSPVGASVAHWVDGVVFAMIGVHL